jgi:hypothetical protein
MATVQLADVYVPLTFNRRAQLAQTELNQFISSGVAMRDPLLESQFAAGGNIGELPQFNGITTGEPNYSTDNPATSATAQKIASSTQKVRSASRNAHWSTMDLARELAVEDPMAAITNRVGHYWAVDDQKRLIQSMVGVLADNVANDSSDMLYSIATDSASAITDAERISGEAIARATQTLGDHKTKLRAIAMHSVQHTRLAILGLIKEFRDNADGRLLFETYLGMRVIVDDSLPTTVGTNRITYTAILFGEGAVSWGNGRVITPSEIDRNPLAGNGGGETILSSRVNTIYHPSGCSFLSASVASNSATYAELAAAANWDRVVPRKNVPLAFLQVND